ncbi:MAG: hypothetical protein HQK52_08050 [Oligoflexia bacterium]|nr:hypothetical protein [Oligoflexia bacterium]
MNTIFQSKLFPVIIWAPELGKIGTTISYDSETSMIDEKTQATPDFVIGTAFNGESCYVITKERLSPFFTAHKNSRVFMANAAFDIAVAAKIEAINPFDSIETDTIIDILLLENLNAIAATGSATPHISLDDLSIRYLATKLPKDTLDDNGNIIRESFGQFILPSGEIRYQDMPYVYLDYAVKDAIATYLIGNQVLHRAIALCDKFKVDRKLLLSHNLQLKSSYALYRVSQNGLPVDHEKKSEIKAYLQKKISNSLDYLYGGKIFLLTANTVEEADKMAENKMPALVRVQDSYYLYDKNKPMVDLSYKRSEIELLLNPDKFSNDNDIKVVSVKKEICDIFESNGVAIVVDKFAGWSPGKGSDKVLQAILSKIEEKYHICLPRTNADKISKKGDDLEELLGEIDVDNDFIEHYLEYKNNSKLLDFISGNQDVLHPRFNTLVSTGRTSSCRPNVQNFPKDTKECSVRNMVRALPNHVIFAPDYKQIELVALSQTTYKRYGNSEMRDKINSGIDLHKYIVSKIEGRPIEEVTDKEKSKGKPINFGYPGGLGFNRFIKLAKKSYQLFFSIDEAKLFKQIWLDAFPEIKKYLDDDNLSKLEKSGMLKDYCLFTGRRSNDETSQFVFKGIIEGQNETKTTQRQFTLKEKMWAWDVIKRSDFPLKKNFANDIKKMQGSSKLMEVFFRQFSNVILPSGRVRGNTTYCQSKNTPFQGLAADGAKEALYELVKAGYWVVNFIHDEYLIMLPLDSDLDTMSKHVTSILISTMKKHCPDVNVNINPDWMFNWAKEGTHYLKDGKLTLKANDPK